MIKYVIHVALLSLAIAIVAGITTSTMVPQASAEQQFKSQDDKNNPTFPGSGAGKKDNEQASDNTDANCFKHFLAENGGPPAQCY